MASSTVAARYQQMTKSREAYETQQVAFLHRPSSGATRRVRPQSAGAGGWSGSDRDGRAGSGGGGGVVNNCEHSRPTPSLKQRVPPCAAGKRGGASDRGARCRRASLDHPVGPPVICPPPFCRRVNGDSFAATAANTRCGGIGTSPGKPRTRVRPSSANARVGERPGAGHGVGGGLTSSDTVVHRRVHDSHHPTNEHCAEGNGVKGDSGNAPAGSMHTWHHEPSPATIILGSSGTPPAITRAPPKTPPPRPKSAAFRRAESGFAPCPTRPPAAGLTGAQGLAAQARGTYLQNGVGGIGSGGEASPDGRLEFRGRDHQKTTAHRVQHRLRPRSAVARVESTSRHGKAAPAAPVATPAKKVATTASTKLKAAAAVVVSAPFRGSGGHSRGAGGKIGRTRVAPRPQSASARWTTPGGTSAQSKRENVERVMARIFQQKKTWTNEKAPSVAGCGDSGTGEGLGGNPVSTQYQRERLQSARAPAVPSMVAPAPPPVIPKPHTWGTARSAVRSTSLAVAAAEAATALATTAGALGRSGGNGGDTRTEETRPATSREGVRATTWGGGPYARLLGMKGPGSYRRVGVGPLDEFKNNHYRRGAPPNEGGVEYGEGAARAAFGSYDREGRGVGCTKAENLKGSNNGGVGNVENQATVSTANTGSLTPPGGSSSAEGRTVGEVQVSPQLESLTNTSVDYCSPQERLYLRRLMLDLQGSARSSLDFYRLGKVVGEGSFAKVRVAWHKLTGQRVAVKTYEKAKIKDENQWRRISQEVKLMERLNHPRVVRLFETAESSKRIHLVMEHADGGNLCSYVKRRKRLEENEARRITHQLLQGVEYMHGLDIVHRDIKLENVLLDGNGRANAKLVDFGFSAHVKNRRLLHVFCGTPSYMAPEIIKRQEYEGKPVDVWSLGVVLYAMLCGCFPFSGPTYPELYKNISKGVFRLPDWLSPTAASLVRGMLVTDPARRLNLYQVIAHPWLLPTRGVGKVSTGNQYRPASAGAAERRSSPSSPSCQNTSGLNAAGTVRRQSFHISTDPTRDMCAESVKRMEAFGADGAEITRQVLARRHSCLTTTFYLLKNDLSTGAASATRPCSAGEAGERNGNPQRKM